MQILFIATPGANPHNDNHIRLPEAFRRAGCNVVCEPFEQLRYARTSGPQELFVGEHLLTEFDLIWLVGFGPRGDYLSRTQILHQLPDEVFVTPPTAMQHLHSKIPWLSYGPPFMVSADLDAVRGWMQTQPGPWVLKPPAASFGEHVSLLQSPTDLDQAWASRPGETWIAQQYIHAIQEGEIRTLLANGKLIGSYRRRPAAGGWLANLTQAGIPEHASLTAEQHKLVIQIGDELQRQGVGFAAVDCCADYVVEVNVANPGGLATLSELYQQDFALEVAQAFSG